MGNIGTVVQIIGPVVDIEFDEDHLPAIYNAVHIKDDGAESGQPIDVVAEVEQHLGENRVRCVAMEPTDGMVRGMKAEDTGDAIKVPVGTATLGRVMNVIGDPVDEPDPVDVALATACATADLDGDWDVEITEAHHRFKVDAPSGTALQLGEAVADERGQNLDDVAIFGRSGHTGARPPGAIGISSIRAGNIVGDHTVAFVSDTETVELTHHAVDRELFASGALRAAHWLGKQPAGLYGMRDVLGFD